MGAAAEADAWWAVEAGSAQRRCATAVDAGAFYSALAAVGLAYGPAFRTVEAAWAGDGEAASRLRRRAALQGTQVHPADLDGALQASSLLARSGGEGGGAMQLPFAVDAARLRGRAAGALLAEVAGRDAEAADVRLAAGAW